MKTKVLTDENFCFMPYKHLVNRHKTCTRSYSLIHQLLYKNNNRCRPFNTKIQAHGNKKVKIASKSDR